MTHHFQRKFIRKKKQSMKRSDRETLKTRGNDIIQKKNRIKLNKNRIREQETVGSAKGYHCGRSRITIGYQKGQAQRKPWVSGEMIQEWIKIVSGDTRPRKRLKENTGG